MRVKFPSSEQWLYLANLLSGVFFRRDRGNGIRSILIVKWDEIGDMATATHVFRHLRAAYPGAEITVLCKPFVSGLIRFDPDIDHIIEHPSSWKKRYDAVIELRGTWSTLLRSFRYKPVYRLCRASVRWKNRGRQLHETATNFEIIKPLLAENTARLQPELYFSEQDARLVRALLQRKNAGDRYAVFHAGARKKLRQWNPERFAAVAAHLHERHGMFILFIGSDEERKDIELIRSLLRFGQHAVAEDFSLSMLSCLCAGASFYIGNESGPMHIAAAFGVPMVALFGPGVPDVFYPVHKRSAVLHHVLSCNPCDQIHCVRPENPCITLIRTEDAISAAERVLSA